MTAHPPELLTTYKIHIVHDDEVWWGAGRSMAEAREGAALAVIATYRRQQGDPPWLLEPGRRETPETVRAWAGGLRAMLIQITSDSTHKPGWVAELAVLLGDRGAAEALFEEIFNPRASPAV